MMQGIPGMQGMMQGMPGMQGMQGMPIFGGMPGQGFGGFSMGGLPAGFQIGQGATMGTAAGQQGQKKDGKNGKEEGTGMYGDM